MSRGCCCCFASACLAEQASSPLRVIKCFFPWGKQSHPRDTLLQVEWVGAIWPDPVWRRSTSSRPRRGAPDRRSDEAVVSDSEEHKVDEDGDYYHN